MRAPNDPYPDSLDRIIRSRIRGDEEAALAAVTEICFVPPKLMKKRWPAKSAIAKIYTRDHYHCRYCGERVILTAVMHLVSRLYPEQFPFHKLENGLDTPGDYLEVGDSRPRRTHRRRW